MADKHVHQHVHQQPLHFHRSDLLTVALPVWRTRFVQLLFLAGFLGLAARAAWIQLLGQDFYASQGDRRVHAEAPVAARRGQIQDRHGTVLASSVPRASGQGFQRRYPDGEIVAAVVGFTDVDHRGQEGAERSFDPELAGTDGLRAVIQDRLGRAIADAPETVGAVDGRDVRLTLDARIQLLAFRRIKDAVDGHAAKSGSVVVLDARTGDILAMANYPSFDPNERRHWRQDQLRNRAASDAFEPGSVAKPITMATALDLGRVRPETVFDTGPGHLRFEGATISDVGCFGVLTAEGVIEKSSNVGMTLLSRSLSAEEMWQRFRGLGFGERALDEVPGVAVGRVRPWARWKPIEQATMSYGYGFSTSLLGIARAYTAFAGDGAVRPLRLRVSTPARAPVPVYSAKTAAQIRRMLWLAAGGARDASFDADDAIGGKSGTVRKLEGRAYVIGKYRSLFVGMAPISRPRLIVATLIDESTEGGYYGGQIAAPVSREVLREALRLQGIAIPAS
ncbi:peptidoglycan D,D-transpeptidase FtsI family protein [Roseateles chitinivorans]|uniref:peptidoglycan D,D-transpeptidase FtsI family protein n=1 Tax=Roseateles chitinivorans TaxID=2917965 RepID=UPI003D67EF9A